ncbi:MAG TPA: CDP-alcohol phosphatidyltransferase family protein [Polyangia bacterium]|jgi:phosphatidylglycerophosphate synthase|nr:CDP-alcohol phosphatidyltransferase family protein [Polyangia bacterium]
MFSAIREMYARTRKPHDIFWNRFVARPAAAVLLVPLARTGITPNQVTLLTLVVFLIGALVMALMPSSGALVLAAAIIELSYVLDCVDGQLARLKGTSSPVGAHLDFLMDEIKAFVLVAAVGVRLWLPAHDARWLIEALLGLTAVASAISLTTFVRRPEYAVATGAAVNMGTGDYGDGFAAPEAAPAAKTRLLPIRAVEAIGRFIVHYPSYIMFVALADRMDLFLHAYAGINAAYASRSLLGVAVKLGRRA